MTSTHPPSSDFSTAVLAGALIRRRAWIIGSVGLAVLIAMTWVFTRPRSYSSSSAFTSQSRRPQANLTGLAAQFGIAVPGAEPSQSPQFYADFVRSRRVLAAAAESTYRVGDQGERPLAAILGRERATPERTREAVVRYLSKRVTASANTRTGVVRVTVRLPAPELAMEVNRRLLDLLNEFNLRTRQTQAGAERTFTERRLKESEDDLRGAEDQLQRFLQRNRDFRNSPELTFQHDRLQRMITVRQELFTTLAQAFEQARIEEVRDTPVITVIERAERPVRPDSRGTTPALVLAIVGGLTVGTVLALGKEAIAGLRSTEPTSELGGMLRGWLASETASQRANDPPSNRQRI